MKVKVVNHKVELTKGQKAYVYSPNVVINKERYNELVQKYVEQYDSIKVGDFNITTFRKNGSGEYRVHLMLHLIGLFNEDGMVDVSDCFEIMEVKYQPTVHVDNGWLTFIGVMMLISIVVSIIIG